MSCILPHTTALPVQPQQLSDKYHIGMHPNPSMAPFLHRYIHCFCYALLDSSVCSLLFSFISTIAVNLKAESIVNALSSSYCTLSTWALAPFFHTSIIPFKIPTAEVSPALAGLIFERQHTFWCYPRG